MIEFNGYLTGSAAKFHIKKGRKMGIGILFFATALFVPSIVYFAIKTQNWLLLVFYLSLFIYIPLIAHIPQGKKQRQDLTPNRIYTEDEYIISVTNRNTEYKEIDSVKLVRDHGEFYELVFPFGKVTENFICQKSLLSKGTLEEFEALFEGKIVKL